MRPQVRELVSRPSLILSDKSPVETVEWAGELIDDFVKPATDEEAVALLELLSRFDDSSCFGLNWTILHFIETAPNWPIWSALKNTPGEWPETLRQRLENAGQSPPG
jgi:hypothetical protein